MTGAGGLTAAPSSARVSRGRAPTLASVHELAELRPAFVRSLGAEFDLAALSGRLCPVLFADRSVAIFTLSDYAASDQIEEVERMVLRRGYRLGAHPRYILPPPLLLTIARGQITGDMLRSHRENRPQGQASALAAVFLDLIRWGVRHGASDVHLNVNRRRADADIRYTVGGLYVAPVCFQGMANATLLEVLAVAWMNIRGGNGAVFDPLNEQQGRMRLSVDDRPIMLRWASLATDTGPSVCLRILHLEPEGGPRTLDELGYLPSHVHMLECARRQEGGAVVLAGVVGSGKSTTAATLLRGIPGTRKVVTLEDPVEYLIPNALQNTVGRSLDASFDSAFQAKLKTLKRSAMNDLLLGEVRDLETGKAFMDLAGSGMNVYTTTHTGAAFMIPERLASDFIGVSRDFLATPGVLKLLIYQALVPRLCPACALPFASLYKDAACDWRTWERRFGLACQTDTSTLRVRNPAGCPACRQAQLPQLAGTQGRTVVAEMIDPAADAAFMELVRRRDNLGLLDLVNGMPHGAVASPDMSGKRAALCAAYKAIAGEIDPREIEPRFGPVVGPRTAGNPMARNRMQRLRHG